MKNKTDRMDRKPLRKKNALPLRGMALVLCLVLLLPMFFACTPKEEVTTPIPTTPAETTTTTTMTAEQLLESSIKAAYYKAHAEVIGTELSVVIHEQFGDVFVVEVTRDATRIDLEYEIIANREFLYFTEARLEVYREGEVLIPLAEAHAAGLLTDENIRTLYDTFREAYRDYYDIYSIEKYIQEELRPPSVEESRFYHDRILISLRGFADKEIPTIEEFAQFGCVRIQPHEYFFEDYYLIVEETTLEELEKMVRAIEAADFPKIYWVSLARNDEYYPT